jgi:hypothetical protein
MASNNATPPKPTTGNHEWQTLIEFTLFRESGSAELATDLVVGTVQTLNWPAAHLEQLKLALARASQNALEWGHLDDPGARLVVRVFVSQGGEATQKAGWTGGEPGERQQTGRPASGGWGFFLVQRQGDASPVLTSGPRHLIELFLYKEGEPSRKYK